MASRRSLLVLIWALAAAPPSWLGATAVGVQKVFEETVVAGFTITAPPVPQATGLCEKWNIFGKRADNSSSVLPSCSFGACGATCLSQGSFCCNPGGSRAIEPQWICDNGACITSVRGVLGVVDCYDPDNPSGTTQSCIDNVPTATCNPTDRCYTCSADQPFCHWQTYVDPASPTLRWFSCIASSTADETFYATSVTNHLLATGKASNGTSSSSLSPGEIGGIAAAGAVALIASVAIIAWCCVRRRKAEEKREEYHPGPPDQKPPMASPEYQPSGSVAYYEPVQTHELPDDDPQKQAYHWKGGVPMEASSTPVAELPAGLPPSGHNTMMANTQLYDEDGFLHDNNNLHQQYNNNPDAISPPIQYRGYSPAQDTLVHSPSTPGGSSVISPAVGALRRGSDNRSPAQVSMHNYTPTNMSPGQSPLPLNQEYFAPPPEPGSSSNARRRSGQQQQQQQQQPQQQQYQQQQQYHQPQPQQGPPGHYAPNGREYGRWGSGDSTRKG